MDHFLKIDGEVESRTDVDLHVESTLEVFIQLLEEIVPVSKYDMKITYNDNIDLTFEHGGKTYTFEES